MPRPTQGSTQPLRIRGCHPLWPDFPDRSAQVMSTTGLLRFRSPLLAESRLMSFPPGTEMFQFPGFASPPYVFRWRYPKGVGCPIRTSTDQSLLAAPRGFSQRATSFVASWCQGIHRMPFLYSIFATLLRRAASTMHRNHPQTQLSGFSRQKTTATRPPTALRTVLEISTPHTTGFSRIAPPWPLARAPREIRQNRSQRL